MFTSINAYLYLVSIVYNTEFSLQFFLYTYYIPMIIIGCFPFTQKATLYNAIFDKALSIKETVEHCCTLFDTRKSRVTECFTQYYQQEIKNFPLCL